MKENTQQLHRKGLLRSYPMFFIVVFSIFSFLLIRGGLEAYAKQENISEKQERLQKEQGKLMEHQRVMEYQAGDIDSDFGKEKYIRETYGLIKPGEVVLYIVDEGFEEDSYIIDNKEKKGLFKRSLE